MENNKVNVIILILMFIVLGLQLTHVIPSLIGCMIVLSLKGIMDLFFKDVASKINEAFYLGTTLALLWVLETQL